MSIRNMIRMILNESFESDKSELAELYPDFAAQISQMGPKWIMWLSSRFGSAKKREEVHPFGDAITSILAFSKKDSAIAQKYKSSEQWRSAVDSAFPERKWSTPADTMTMTVDDMETLLAMSERKKQNVDMSSASVDGDFLAKVGPWNLWMPTTKENSCTIAGVDPLTLKPATTWCTARTSGSNLFYSYVARGENIILFYVIKDNALDADDRLSIGFVNGKAHLDGSHGGVSVNGANNGITDGILGALFGQHYDAIMSILTKKSSQIAGEHPAKGKIKEAAVNIAAFHSIVRGLSSEESSDIKTLIASQGEISEEVAMALAKDYDFDVWNKLASNKNCPENVLQLLAKFCLNRSNVKDNVIPEDLAYILAAVASNERTSTQLLTFLSTNSSHSEDSIRKHVAANINTPHEVLRELVHDEILRIYVAQNINAPLDIFTVLLQEEDFMVREVLAFNENIPVEFLVQLSKDSVKDVRASVARNKNATPEILNALARDRQVMVRIAVAKNKNTPETALEDLVKDEYSHVRKAILKNPNITIDLLYLLTRDEDEAVYIQADRLLQKKLNENVFRRLLKYKY